MSSAQADPDELRAFAATLRRCTGELENILGDVRADVLAASDRWADSEYEKFVETFRSTEAVLGRLATAIEQFTPVLLADADSLEAYRRLSLE